MEKEIFDTITDYIFSVQALVDRVNRMYTVKIEGDRISDSITHLLKRIDRVELEKTKILVNLDVNLTPITLLAYLNNYVLITDMLIDILENNNGDVRLAINRIEHYEDKLLKELKKHIKQSELDKFIDDWLPVFKHFKIPNQLMNRFKQECEQKGFKLINVLTEMLKRHKLEE